VLAIPVSADWLIWAFILVNGLAIAAALLTAGSVLVHLSLKALRRSLARRAALCAIIAAILSAIFREIRAAQVSGSRATPMSVPRICATPPAGNRARVAFLSIAFTITWAKIGSYMLWPATLASGRTAHVAIRASAT
jgi:hypothetical protein